MTKKVLNISLLIGVMTLICSSCGKDDNNSFSGNPLNGKSSAVFNSDITYGSMTDQDGNVYKTVTIGTQTWMAENLRTTKYNDGTKIPIVTNDTVWENLTTGAYCNYNNTTNNDTIATLGRLYNWYVVNTGKLAPIGWHVATDDEWTTLITYLGGIRVSGGYLKETDTIHWNTPNSEATNSTGFTALPGGYRVSNGLFGNIGKFGCWSSATEIAAWTCYMDCYSSYVSRVSDLKQLGVSVRCIRD